MEWVVVTETPLGNMCLLFYVADLIVQETDLNSMVPVWRDLTLVVISELTVL